MTGVAGYIAPRHLKAVQDTGNRLVAAIDPNDSVGILDQYFPAAKFFIEYERFDRYLEKVKRKGEAERVHFLSICSPNYLHDAHIRTALRIGADAVCEKPLVINPWNLDALSQLEKETGKRVYTVLQLREHPAIIALKNRFMNTGKRHQVKLSYVAPRGNWYLISWKGKEERSGGLGTNIGIHFFDMLIWLFGKVEKLEVHLRNSKVWSGCMQLKNADVSWFLSIDSDYLPNASLFQTYRSIEIDGDEVEFSGGFEDLHTAVYRRVLTGNGFGIEDTRPAIDLVYKIRQESVTKPVMGFHPFYRNAFISGGEK